MIPKENEAEDRSEQLPSVEEAKMWASLQSQGSSDADVFALKHSETDKTDPDDDVEMAAVHDQLPSLEDAKLYSGSTGRNKNFTRNIFLGLTFLMFIIGAIIALALVLPRNSGEPSISTPSGEGESFTTALPVISETPGPVSTNTPTSAPVPANTPTSAPVPGGDSVIPSDTPKSRYSLIIETLSNASISNLQDLQTPGSPQQKAAAWIADKDPRQISLAEDNLDSLTQRYVLTVFYYAGGGEKWSHQLSFLTGEDECNWNVVGLASDQRTLETFGVSCFRGVDKIRMPSGFLNGKLPQELSSLTDMEVFDIFNNPGLEGGFPSFVKGLPLLSYLAVHYCKFTGTLPEWLGTMTALQTLGLSNNAFSGTLPSVAGASNLEYVYLDDNNLTGDISSFGKLTKLKYLIIEDNHIGGQLTDALISNWSQMEVLDVSNNPIKSTIPSSLFNLPKLRILDLHACEFYGQIPAFDRDNIVLELLTLQDNYLTGAISPLLSQFLVLRQLDLSNNQLTSTIPGTVGTMSKLQYLYLANNTLASAEIPAFLSSLTSLTDLSLKNTNRIGQIPQFIGDLTKLSLLDLGYNKLQGSIPDALGQLTNMKYLLLNKNQLQGTIPASMKSLANLNFFMVDNNDIIGSADAVCSAQKTPQVFTSDCGGSAPEVTCSCCSTCCVDSDTSCNDNFWLGDTNPIWELGYARSDPSDTNQVYTVKFLGDLP